MELQFREITLADKPLFDKMLEVSFHKTQECSFAYVYLWRENFDLHVASGDGWLVIRIDMGDYYAFNPVCVPQLMPELMDSIEEYAHNNEQPVILSFINKSDCQEILRIRPDWVQSPQDLYFDYIYDIRQMHTMEGKVYKTVRNLISRFQRDCPNYTFEVYKDSDYDECMAVLDEWCRVKDEQEKDYSPLEVQINREALRLRKELDMEALVLRVDGRIIGYVIDYVHPGSDTVIAFCQKAISISPGVNKMIDHHECGYFMDKYKYINYGDDGGNLRLRASKEDLNPIEKVYKYVITEAGLEEEEEDADE